MNRRRLVEVPLAFALKRVLGAPKDERERAAAPPRGSGATAPVAHPRGHEPSALPALAALAVGALLLIVFDEWFTRLLGVLALFAFIAAGVFAVASPAFLEHEEEEG
jgi:hypothetical protein